MKLLGYEYLKLVQKRLLVLLIPILWVGNGFLYGQEQVSQNGFLLQNIHEYRQTESQYARLPLNEAYKKSIARQEELGAYQLIAQAAQDPDNRALAEEMSRLIERSPSLVDAFEHSPYRGNLAMLSRDAYISELISTQLETMDGYKEYLHQIQQQSEELLGVSIFQDEDSFSYRNIIRTPKEFAQLERLPLKLGGEWGIVSATTFSITDVLLILILFLLCVYLFQSDRDSGFASISRSTRKGRVPLAVAKITALISMSVLLPLLFHGTLLLIAYYLYGGFGDLSRYVQSMEAFRYCNLPLTVKQYLLVYLACKAFAHIVMAMVLAFLFQLFARAEMVFGCLFSFLAWQYISFKFIHPLSPFQLVKYMNVFSFYDTYGLLAVYKNMNVGGYPVACVWASAFSAFLISCLFLVLGIVMYAWRPPYSTSPQLVQWASAQLAKLRRPPSYVQLARHEGFKLFFGGKLYVILVLALLIGYQDLDKHNLTFNEEDGIYNGYMDRLEGKLNQPKTDFILQEKRRFEELPSQYSEIQDQYQSQELSPSEYLEKKSKLDIFALKEPSFKRVYSQYLHLEELKRLKGIEGSFLNELSTDYYFRNAYRDKINGLVFTSLLVVSLCRLFPGENQSGMKMLLLSTPKGRLPLFLVKHGLAGLTGVCLMILVYYPPLINLLNQYPSLDWSAPIQSLSFFQHLNGRVTVKEFVIGVSAFQLLASVLASVFVLYVSLLIRRQAPALLMSSVILVLPLLVELAGFEGLRLYTFNGFFMLFDWLGSSSLLSVGLYAGLSALGAGGAIMLARIRYIHPRHREWG